MYIALNDVASFVKHTCVTMLNSVVSDFIGKHSKKLRIS